MSKLDEVRRGIKERGWATGEDRYVEAIFEYGSVKNPVFPDAATLELYRGRLPDSLLRIWVEHGWGSWRQGRFWLCDPAFLQPVVSTLLEGDPEFDPQKVIPFAYDGFGQFYIWVEDLRILHVDPVLNYARLDKFSTWNKYTQRADSMAEAFFYEFYSFLSSGDDFGAFMDEAELDEDMLPKLLERYGELEPGEIYGFFPAVVMGGDCSIENIQRTPLLSHLMFIFEMQKPAYLEYLFPKEGEPGFGSYRHIRLLGNPDQ